jgi:hypothetical protein
MPRQGTFYLGRVIKGGRLGQDTLIQALREPRAIVHRDFAWTFTDFHEGPSGNWYFARLAKYKPVGTVTVVDHDRHREVPQYAPDLVVAASPFVYVPDFSGIAYLHVWNQIQREAFPRRFAEVVERTLDDFFVRCEIEPISDLRSFVRKLASVEAILDISARVHLPNPLFGPLWKSLRDYVARRNAATVKLEEQAKAGGLKTRLPELVERTRETTISEETEVALGDAAVLMAADGYGSARVTGVRQHRRVVIRTSETQVTFSHNADAEPADLAEQSTAALTTHARTQALRHDDPED